MADQDEFDAAPARFAKPQNAARCTTVMTVEVDKLTLQLITAEWMSAKAFGANASQKSVVASILNGWAQQRLHLRTLQDSLLAGNLDTPDMDEVGLRIVGGQQ